ncbi:DUF308 domain-containing protein [Kocuria massiliensis]|uniref:DUF308 domain-containing protein n=1 Tax=Kocuria massiliensis TaxID=1926282 RepID=UPI000A1CEF15|nr:DUF308 domain-containing protein [Kocuria massiliensis]
MSAPAPTPSVQELRALFGPVLLRAMIYLAFGLTTVFWQEPTLTVVRWGIGLFMILQGVALIYMQRSLTERAWGHGNTHSRVIQSYAILYLVGGVATTAFSGSLPILVLVVGLIFSIGGVTELLQGFRATGTSAMARDWKIAGVVTFLTGIVLFMIGDLGPKAAFGITGGGAIIVGIFMVLAALTFRHDAASADSAKLDT